MHMQLLGRSRDKGGCREMHSTHATAGSVRNGLKWKYSAVRRVSAVDGVAGARVKGELGSWGAWSREAESLTARFAQIMAINVVTIPFSCSMA